MKKRTGTVVLAVALALGLSLPAYAAHEAYRLFEYVSARLETVSVDLATGRTTASQAAVEIEDLSVIVGVGRTMFAPDLAAAGGGATADQGLAGLQALLAAASQALARNGSSDLGEAALVNLARAGNANAAVANVLRLGFSNISSSEIAALQAAAPGTATPVRAADYRAPIAQDSIASVFTTNAMTTRIGHASFDARGQLPLVLSGASVLVGGRLAPLFYVSSNQINFLMPAGLAPGERVEVAVTGVNGVVATAAVQVAVAWPSIFSEDSSGRGPGSILNGATFARGPFSLTTPQNPGDDKRTRLAIFVTGIRNAPNTDATNDIRLADGSILPNLAESVTVTVGGRRAAVEFAGKHSLFLGLDQINIVLTEDLARSGPQDLVVQVGPASSNTVMVTIQ